MNTERLLNVAKALRESWLPIPGFPLYLVSSLGRVRGLKRPHLNDGIRRPAIVCGYERISLTAADGTRKNVFVHVLVIEAFIGPRPAGMQASHKDGNCRNNCDENLEWATVLENNRLRHKHGTMPSGHRSYNSKFSPEQLEVIRSSHGFVSQKELADRFGVCRTTIQRAQYRQTYRVVERFVAEHS